MDITMPQLGESVTEGTITKWLKKPGDKIEKYEPICEVSTDKVNAEVPSSTAGTLVEVVATEGSAVEVGKIICRIQALGDVALNELNTPTTGTKDMPKVENQSERQSNVARYSPAVLRLAQENNIELDLIEGTGQGGRITRKDVVRAIEEGLTTLKPTIVEDKGEKEISLPTVKESKEVGSLMDVEVPLTPIRKAIADKMVKSKKEIPHAWLMMEADVSGLVSIRREMKKEFMEREGINLSYVPFFIKATVDALKEYPQLNAVWAQDKIVLKKEIHISLAIATEDALYVPVIHEADEKSILGLAKSVEHLIEKTKSSKLTLADTQGGTFTVNNTGSFGSVASTPIINYPQAAILSCESIIRRPVVINDMIGIRDRMNLCLSIDHRIVDGFLAGRFLSSVRERLESYQKEDVT